MSEKELSEHFQRYFKQWFDIKTEINPIGSKLRIDLILISKLNKDFVFGVELKTDKHKRGNDLVKFVLQAQKYASMDFNINGKSRKIPVVIAPSISKDFIQIQKGADVITDGRKKYYQAFHPVTLKHHNLNGLLSGFNIGEVRKVYRGRHLGYGFIFKNKFLWHTSIGVHETNYKKYY